MISDLFRNQSTRKNFRGPGTEISDMEREKRNRASKQFSSLLHYLSLGISFAPLRR